MRLFEDMSKKHVVFWALTCQMCELFMCRKYSPMLVFRIIQPSHLTDVLFLTNRGLIKR